MQEGQERRRSVPMEHGVRAQLCPGGSAQDPVVKHELTWLLEKGWKRSRDGKGRDAGH